jgi:hypothetical protein
MFAAVKEPPPKGLGHFPKVLDVIVENVLKRNIR